MAGFEFVGGMIVPLGEGASAYRQVMSAGQSPNRDGDQTDAADAVSKTMGRSPSKRLAPAQTSLFGDTEQTAPAKPKPAKRLERPRDIIKAAKSRIRDIKREIARADKLRTELEQLTRLVAAAEAPQLAVVPVARAAR